MNSKQVLLIEDDVILADITREILTAYGYCVSWAGTWNEAFEILTSNTEFDVILLDLELGKQRGETLIEALRENGVSLPKIIVMSGVPAADLYHAAQRVRAAGVLAKPCNPAAIKAVIERVAVA